jgi:hypothetical protein
MIRFGIPLVREESSALESPMTPEVKVNGRAANTTNRWTPVKTPPMVVGKTAAAVQTL